MQGSKDVGEGIGCVLIAIAILILFGGFGILTAWQHKIEAETEAIKNPPHAKP